MKQIITYRKTVNTDPLKAHCAGCWELKSKAWMRPGKVWTTVGWRTVITVLDVLNPVTKRLETVEKEKKFPVDEFSRGLICEECASDFRMITKTRRDGSTYYVPRVKMDARVSSTTTVNPGLSHRELHKPVRVEKESVPVNRKRGVTGAGRLLYDPLTRKLRQEVEPVVHGGCYDRFTR